MPYIDIEDWKSANPAKHILVDSFGYPWKILLNLGDQKPGHALEVRCPDYSSEILYMREQMDGHYYVFDCNGLLLEMNQPASRITLQRLYIQFDFV